MEPRLVSFILVTWNSAPYLPRCLAGMRQQTYSRTELIVVDNASADDSAAQCEAAGATVIKNADNRGFSAAVNQGIEAARGELILLVNPDCYLTPEYTTRLVAALEDAGDDFGAATGLLVRARGHAIEPTSEVDSLGILMTRSGRHFDLGQGSPVSALANASRWVEVFGVSGAAAMYRKSFLDDVAIEGKAFDEDFFAYREDADLAWRGRLFGWRALCEPRAVAHHVRRVTPEARVQLPASINMHSVKNRFLLRLKNQGRYLALRNAPFELARDLVVMAATVMVETSSLAAFGWLWRNRRRVMTTRRIIQARRKVSDRALARWFR
jgi:GT2 family glycosyltransferase